MVQGRGFVTNLQMIKDLRNLNENCQCCNLIITYVTLQMTCLCYAGSYSCDLLQINSPSSKGEDLKTVQNSPSRYFKITIIPLLPFPQVLLPVAEINNFKNCSSSLRAIVLTWNKMGWIVITVWVLSIFLQIRRFGRKMDIGPTLPTHITLSMSLRSLLPASWNCLCPQKDTNRLWSARAERHSFRQCDDQEQNHPI